MTIVRFFQKRSLFTLLGALLILISVLTPKMAPPVGQDVDRSQLSAGTQFTMAWRRLFQIAGLGLLVVGYWREDSIRRERYD